MALAVLGFLLGECGIAPAELVVGDIAIDAMLVQVVNGVFESTGLNLRIFLQAQRLG